MISAALTPNGLLPEKISPRHRDRQSAACQCRPRLQTELRTSALKRGGYPIFQDDARPTIEHRCLGRLG